MTAFRRASQARSASRSPISSPTGRRATSWSSGSANSRCKSEIGTLAGYAYVTPFDARPAHGLRVRPHRRRQEHAGAAAPRRHHPRRVRRRQSGPRRAASASSRRAAACSCSCATAPPACRRTPSRSRADRLRGCALAAMARGRPRRPDPQGPRHLLDPAADLAPSSPMSASPASASRSCRPNDRRLEPG